MYRGRDAGATGLPEAGGPVLTRASVSLYPRDCSVDSPPFLPHLGHDSIRWWCGSTIASGIGAVEVLVGG